MAKRGKAALFAVAGAIMLTMTATPSASAIIGDMTPPHGTRSW
ncbi:hypothetical protein NKH18_27300 [Streptomyces sp. M10(2022)]